MLTYSKIIRFSNNDNVIIIDGDGDTVARGPIGLVREAVVKALDTLEAEWAQEHQEGPLPLFELTPADTSRPSQVDRARILRESPEEARERATKEAKERFLSTAPVKKR